MNSRKKIRSETENEPRISQVVFVMSDGSIQVIGQNNLSEFYCAIDREWKLRVWNNIESEIHKMN